MANYCHECGKESIPQAKYCDACGTTLIDNRSSATHHNEASNYRAAPNSADNNNGFKSEFWQTSTSEYSGDDSSYEHVHADQSANDANNTEGGRDLSGIRGWLILPALGLILSIFFVSAGILFAVSDLIDVSQQGGEVYAFILTEIIFLVAFLIMTIVTTYHFFKKKRETKSLFIAYLFADLIIMLILITWAVGIDLNQEYIDALGSDLAQAIGGVIIWAPYFGLSKRVKNTFIH